MIHTPPLFCTFLVIISFSNPPLWYFLLVSLFHVSLARIQIVLLIFMSLITFLTFGPILRHFWAENTGSEAPGRSLLSHRTVCLVDGRSRAVGCIPCATGDSRAGRPAGIILSPLELPVGSYWHQYLPSDWMPGSNNRNCSFRPHYRILQHLVHLSTCVFLTAIIPFSVYDVSIHLDYVRTIFNTVSIHLDRNKVTIQLDYSKQLFNGVFFPHL